MNHEKLPGWLDYIGDYTTQTELYRDYNKSIIRIPIDEPGFNGKIGGVSFSWLTQ